VIAGKRVLGLIPARGGSKRLPRKNLLPLAGKPLIAWTIEAALASRYLDRVVLSSDDDEIMGVAERYGCEVPFRRPDSLAADHTPGIDPVLHAIEELPGYDYVVLLQPTSPLRTANDIDGAMEKCHDRGALSCVSVCRADKPPHWMYTLDDREHLSPIMPDGPRVHRGQDLEVYTLNGALYVAAVPDLIRTEELVTDETTAFVMPGWRSVDVDTLLDLQWCEFLLRNRPDHDHPINERSHAGNTI
jgi:CMP-N,N'-diacetyllegionaminic acid synthase